MKQTKKWKEKDDEKGIKIQMKYHQIILKNDMIVEDVKIFVKSDPRQKNLKLSKKLQKLK